MNRVRQYEWSSMTSGDLDMPSTGGVVSRYDSTNLLALVNALVMLGSWSSYIKTS
jgi:hypothetical protein